MPMPPDPAALIVDSRDGLAEVCAALRAAGVFAFDTEFIRERSYRPRVCLVQAATADRVVLIDPLRVDLACFWELVVDPGVLTVVHSGEQDLEICHLETGRVPANVLDVQVAAGFAGLAYPLSYGSLVREALGVELSQSETFSEWGQRPLTRDQLAYAVEDVLYLLPLEELLEKRLRELGRLSWVREEIQHLQSEDFYAREAHDAWQRVRGLGSLSRRGLAVLRELAIWRERAAEHQDVPSRTLLKDEVLVAVARRMPQNARQLKGVRGFPTPLLQRAGPGVLEAVARGAAVPEDQCPSPSERREERPGERMLADLAAAVGQSLCLSGDLAHSLFGTRADYQELAEALSGGERPPGAPPPRLLSGWRNEFAGATLTAVLAGRASLRVAGGPEAPRLEVEGQGR